MSWRNLVSAFRESHEVFREISRNGKVFAKLSDCDVMLSKYLKNEAPIMSHRDVMANSRHLYFNCMISIAIACARKKSPHASAGRHATIYHAYEFLHAGCQ